MATFIDKVLAGQAKPEDIDDYVDRWHETDQGKHLFLYNYLGMTQDEYAAWVKWPLTLESILNERRKAMQKTLLDPDERELRDGIDKAHDQFATLLADYCLKHPGVVFQFTVSMTKITNHDGSDEAIEKVMFNESIDANWRPGG